MKKIVEIKNFATTVIGDVYVDVDIQFKEKTPITSVEEKIVKDKINADLGALAWEIKQLIKEKVNSYFEN